MKKILIVDDSPEIIFTIKDGLENLELNYEVTSIDNGKLCLDYIKSNPPVDLVILDIMMPEINGWEVFKEIRNNSDWEKTPIIFLTAKTDNFSKGYGKLIAEDYIEKPFNMRELVEKIESTLHKPTEISDEKKKVVNDLLSKIPSK